MEVEGGEGDESFLGSCLRFRGILRRKKKEKEIK